MKIFKFGSLIALLITGLSFTACSDDDDNESGSTSKLVGLWESEKIIEWYKEDGVIVEGSLDEEDDTDLRYEFGEDGVLTMYERYNGTWHEDGVGRYKYSGGKIYMSEDGEEWDGGVSVKRLDDNVLILEGHAKYREDGVNCEDYMKLTCRRISE